MFLLTDRVNIPNPPCEEVGWTSCFIIGFDPQVDVANYCTICFEALIDVLDGGGSCPDGHDASTKARVDVTYRTDFFTEVYNGNCNAPLDGVGQRIVAHVVLILL